MSSKTPSGIIAKHKKFSEWKPVRVVAELMALGMSETEADLLVKKNTPARKQHKKHKPHNSHAKPVYLEELSNHYVVIGDYEMLELKHQDVLIAAVRCANGRSSRQDGATAIKLFGLVKAYPVITTAEVNKFLNRDAFIDSIPLFIDGVEIAGEPMPSANNDYVKEVFRAAKQLKAIAEGLVLSGVLTLKKYLDRAPTSEDVNRAVGIVAPVIINPYFHRVDYANDYSVTPVVHREDSKRIICEWKEHLKNRGNSKPRGRTLESDTSAVTEGEKNA